MARGTRFTRIDQNASESNLSTVNPIQLEDEEEGGYGEMHSSGLSNESKGGYCANTLKKRGLVIVGTVTTLILIAVIISMTYLDGSISKNTTDSSSYVKFDDFHTTGSNGAVASDSSTCSDMGVSILQQGGNAVDAAVTTALCLGVVSPMSSGIGGGCFVLFHNSTSGENVFIDSREVAPAAATANMFEAEPLLAQDGGLAVAVLAEVKGLHLAWQRHGGKVLPWSELVLPVATLAERWTISAQLSANIEEHGREHLLSGQFPELSKLYVKSDGVLKSTGDVVEQPALAQTLRMIAAHGPDYIYDTMATTLAQEIVASGGVVTAQDIRGYEPIVYAALEADFMGHLYVGVGGSSSGGAVVAGILKYMGSFAQPLVSQGLLYAHRLVEAMKHGFAMRLHLGDPEYVNTAEVVAALLSSEYMQQLQEGSLDASVLPLRDYGGEFNMTAIAPKDSGTTHLSVVDAAGNAVALTSTINTYFGSKVVSPSTGILLNNQMDDFSIPGASNYFGLAPSPFNYPAPHKRPLSSMSPSIVLQGSSGSASSVRLVGGASGGPRIITATLQVILNTIGLGLDPLSALIAPRMHSQLLPDKVDLEDQPLPVLASSSASPSIRTAEAVYASLRSRGHYNVSHCDTGMGVAQFITVDRDSGTLHAVSDPRKDGRPAAY